MEINLKDYIVKFAILIFLLLGIHLLVYRALGGYLGVSVKYLVEMYVFLMVLNVTHFIALQWLFKRWPKYAGLLFTALSMLKMFIAIVYLWPYIFPSTEQSIAIVLNFMVIYFVTLTFEVIIVAKNMTKI